MTGFTACAERSAVGIVRFPQDMCGKLMHCVVADLDKSSEDESSGYGTESSQGQRASKTRSASDHRQRLIAAGGMDRILIAMRQHLTARAVQRFGCRVILFLAVGSTSRQRAIAKSVGTSCCEARQTARLLYSPFQPSRALHERMIDTACSCIAAAYSLASFSFCLKGFAAYLRESKYVCA